MFLGPYLLRGLLPRPQYTAVSCLLDVLRRMSSRAVRTDELGQLRLDTARALHLFETSFPTTHHTVIFHLLTHLVDVLERWGPLSSTWQYSMER